MDSEDPHDIRFDAQRRRSGSEPWCLPTIPGRRKKRIPGKQGTGKHVRGEENCSFPDDSAGNLPGNKGRRCKPEGARGSLTADGHRPDRPQKRTAAIQSAESRAGGVSSLPERHTPASGRSEGRTVPDLVRSGSDTGQCVRG